MILAEAIKKRSFDAALKLKVSSNHSNRETTRHFGMKSECGSVIK